MSNLIIASLYEKYKNMILCMSKEYRNWHITDNIYSEADFAKVMNNQKYILNTVYNPEDEKFIYMVLFHTNSNYLAKTDTFRQFLELLINKTHKQDSDRKTKFLEKFIDNSVNNKKKIIAKIMTENKKSIETIFVTKKELTTYFLRNIQLKNKKINLIVHNYLHKHFIIEISRGPGCSKHIRLTKAEASNVLSKQLVTSPHHLPRILINDPHIIWCGAKIGEVVKIIRYSELSGISLAYRLVVPLSGRLEKSNILDSDEEQEEDNDLGDLDDNEDVNAEEENEEEEETPVKKEEEEPLSDDDYDDEY
jgi:DNA-directed RNA polymerase subunit H (RpoH/RPB5)